MTPDEFNARYPVGTPVIAYPGVRPEDGARGWECTRLDTRTRSVAQMLADTPVVWVDGYSSCIALTHVDVRTDAEMETDRG